MHYSSAKRINALPSPRFVCIIAHAGWTKLATTLWDLPAGHYHVRP